MGRSEQIYLWPLSPRQSRTVSMSKISLVILVLVLLVCLTVAAMEVEETSLREVRDAAPDPNFRKLSKKNNRKLSKKNNRKLSKKNNRKLSKKNNRKLRAAKSLCLTGLKGPWASWRGTRTRTSSAG